VLDGALGHSGEPGQTGPAGHPAPPTCGDRHLPCLKGLLTGGGTAGSATSNTRTPFDDIFGEPEFECECADAKLEWR
jgi:hypothetical protein